MRDNQRVVVPDTNKATVEHPMEGLDQGHAILDCVRSAVLNCPDMRRVYFRAAASIPDVQPSYSAPEVVSISHIQAEHCIPHGAIHEVLLDASLTFARRQAQEFSCLW